jgi:hypothetical protein
MDGPAEHSSRVEILHKPIKTMLTTVVSQDPVYVYFDCDEQSYLRF